MNISLGSRLKSAWNAFRNKNPTSGFPYYGGGFSYRPDRLRLNRGGERTIINTIYNRISVDCASVAIEHVKLDENGRFREVVNSSLNERLTLEANIDQTGRAFIQDVVMSMLDEGAVAVVPVDTDDDPEEGMRGSFDILSMRTGKIVEWYPRHVRVRLYDDVTGERQEIVLRKDCVAIIENPFYDVMNGPNSTAQRLIRKLNMMDTVDQMNSSGKLDLIIQLPFMLKGEMKRQQVETRRQEIIDQLQNSQYGIAYIDQTEHITQLNRAVENNMMSQVEYLTNLLFTQLGITSGILDGTADEQAMLNYNNRLIEPILSAITGEFRRKFLSKSARTQRHDIMFFRDPFRLMPVSQIAEMGDKMTRNEIMTSNEVRQVIGMKPSDDPEADKLRNKNLNQAGGAAMAEVSVGSDAQDQIVEDLLSSLESQIDQIIAGVGDDDGTTHADEGEPETEEGEP